MKLQKNKNSTKISCLSDDKSQEKIVEKKQETKTIDQPVGLTRSKKVFDPSITMSLPHSILSAGGGSIKDTGGPGRSQTRMSTSNTIFEEDKLEKMSKEISNKERTQQNREDINKLRNGLKRERLDEMVEGLRSTDNRKAASISSMAPHTEQSTRSGSMKNHISIFDQFEGKNDFNRVPEKSVGEKLTGMQERSSRVDDTWRGIKPAFSSKDINARIVDSMIGKDEKK